MKYQMLRTGQNRGWASRTILNIVHDADSCGLPPASCLLQQDLTLLEINGREEEKESGESDIRILRLFKSCQAYDYEPVTSVCL